MLLMVLRGQEFTSSVFCSRSTIFTTTLGRLDLPFHTFVHLLHGLDLFFNIQWTADETELPLPLLNVLADIAPFVLVMLQAVRQTRAIQVRQDTSHDCIQRTERGDGAMRTTGGTKRRDSSSGHDLDTQTDVHEEVEELKAFTRALLGLYDTRVDTDVERCTSAVLREVEGWNAVDARQRAEDEQLVVRGDQVACFGVHDIPGHMCQSTRVE